MKKHFLLLVIMVVFAQAHIKAQQWGDYTLYSTQNTKYAYLLDTTGTVTHTWSLATGNTGYSTYMLPGGSILRTISHTGNSFNGGGMTGEVQKADWNGNITWDYVYSTSTYCMHHDVCPMPNGNVLIISYETKTAAQLTQAGGSTSHVIWPDKIIEVQPSGATGGNIVWEWHVWDHLVQSVDATKDNYQTSVSVHPELLNINYKNTSGTTDWMHTNGVDYNPLLDQIAFSSHNMNEIYVIDHSTTSAQAATHSGGNSGHGGDFLYRWGNPAAYGGTGTADFNVVHDGHWIKQGCPRAGQLVGFNNNGVSNSQSAVDIFSPPISGLSYTTVAGSPATYSKRFALSGHAADMGNSQKLPNGNMLFCIATSGLIYETDSIGTNLWSKTVSGTAPKAYRYASCYLSDTSFAIPSITAAGNVLSSSAAASYQWYNNGVMISGATSQTYSATQSGYYTVQVKSANNCVMKYAPLYNYSTLPTGIGQLASDPAFVMYPNPSTGLVYINGVPVTNSPYFVYVYDAVGKLVNSARNAASIDMSGFENGLYQVVIRTESGQSTSNKLVLIK